MKRIYLNSLPDPLFQQLAKHSQLRVISPTPQAARALRVPNQSLEALAQQSLLKQNLRSAPVLIAHRALRAAVAKVIQTLDIDGTTRTLTPALKAILRAGIDLDALEAVGSSRTQQLARLARAYQANIRANKFVDSAEVLWQAAKLKPSSLSILVYGYFNPRMDELAFLNAIGGNGSVMILPCPNHTIFADIQAAVGWLQQQGWQIETSDQFIPTFSQLQTCFMSGSAVPSDVQSHIYTHTEDG